MEKEVLKKQILNAFDCMTKINKGIDDLFKNGVEDVEKLELSKGAERAVNAYVELILEGDLGALEHFYWYAYKVGMNDQSEEYPFDEFIDEIWNYFKV